MHPPPHTHTHTQTFAASQVNLPIALELSPHMLQACNIRNGLFVYTDDLLALEKEASKTPSRFEGFLAHTPLIRQEWYKYMALHPDARYAQYILSGIEKGFHIGFQREACGFPSKRTRNMGSAYQNPEAVSSYLEREFEAGRLLGPFPSRDKPLMSQFRITPFGLIPKRHQHNKWRLIVNLSSPRDRSVNDGINPDLCSLHYSGIDAAIAMVGRLSPGCQLAKLDLQHAYRVVPVHPDDWHLLGMQWRQQVFLDVALPFGLRSAPKIFSALADALLWSMTCRGIQEGIHYLDDFLFGGRPASDECQVALSTALATCAELGFPVASEKIEGPSSVITFLGIELDTVASEVRLPKTKLQLTVGELERWSHRRSCTKRELLSLIGVLQHASMVIKPGRAFLRRMINLSKSVRNLERGIRLNVSFRSDLQWWLTFIQKWNGHCFLPRAVHQIVLFSDASGSWGCGALYGSSWLQFKWPPCAPTNIATKEIIPILFAAAIWGTLWRGTTVTCFCDNTAVVAALRKGNARDEALMHIIRCLSFYAAHFNFTLTPVYIPSEDNAAADALSRNDMARFLRVTPQAYPQPSPIPPAVIRMAVTQKPDWTSAHWRILFKNTIAEV